MAVKILGLVSACVDCPHRRYYSGGAYECSMVRQKLTAGETMPGWCPLSDHPAAQIAPAQRAVANTREILTALKKEVDAGASESRIQEIVTLAIELLPAHAGAE